MAAVKPVSKLTAVQNEIVNLRVAHDFLNPREKMKTSQNVPLLVRLLGYYWTLDRITVL